MPQRRNLLAHCALILTLASSVAVAQDQNNGRGGRGGQNGGPGGGGPGGGGPGGGGPGGGNRGGGPGGWGGFGGGGPGGGPTSVANLVQQQVIQDELKMTDKQKDQVKKIKEDAEKKRPQVQQEANKMATAARQQAAMEAAAAAEANGGTPFNTNNNGNNQNGGPGGRGGRGGPGGRNDAGMQAMRQVMDNFQNQVEAAYLKALDTKQKTRIKQIALQAEGAGAFNNPEVIEKLAMTMEQVQAIESIRNDSRRSQGQIMRSLFEGNNNNNDNGNGNGGGRGRGGFPDQETMQSPEFQAKVKTAQEDQTKLEDQTMANVGKALTKAQRATFNRMIGEKFDVAQLRQGMFNRFRQGGNNPPANGQQAATTPAPAAPAATPTPAPATAEAAPKAPARKSLRDQRGGSSGPN